MVEYLIIAIAFAIMVHFRYIMESLSIVQDLLFHLDIEKEKTSFSPILFSIVFLVLCIITMPIMIMYIFREKREEILKDISGTILKAFFQLEEK